MRDSLDILARLFRGDSVGEGNGEALSLPDGGDGLIAESVEGRADRLPLRIQHCGFEGNEDASFHGNFDYRIYSRTKEKRGWPTAGQPREWMPLEREPKGELQSALQTALARDHAKRTGSGVEAARRAQVGMVDE